MSVCCDVSLNSTADSSLVDKYKKQSHKILNLEDLCKNMEILCFEEKSAESVIASNELKSSVS